MGDGADLTFPGFSAPFNSNYRPDWWNKKCPVCGKKYIARKGKYGSFMGCPDFPKCEGGKTYKIS